MEIAVLTDANPRTTEKHSASILSKYNAETRTAAIAAYYEIELARERREKELLATEAGCANVRPFCFSATSKR